MKSSSNRWRNNRPMTKIELKNASGSLSEYAQKATKEPVIVVKRGKPFAAVVSIRNADEETVSLSTNRKFLAIIKRSRSRCEKGRRHFLQRPPSPAWNKKIARCHFDVL